MVSLMEPHIGSEDALDRRIGLTVIITISVVVLALSVVQPKYAMWIYLLNILAPAVRRFVLNPKAPA
jgi:hypothetical protein